MHQLVQFSIITLVVRSKWHSRLLHALNSASVEVRRNPLPMSISVRTNLASTSYVYLWWTTEKYVAHHLQYTALLATQSIQLTKDLHLLPFLMHISDGSVDITFNGASSMALLT